MSEIHETKSSDGMDGFEIMKECDRFVHRVINGAGDEHLKGWLAYLLEAIEEEKGEALLADIFDLLSDRLSIGRW